MITFSKRLIIAAASLTVPAAAIGMLASLSFGVQSANKGGISAEVRSQVRQAIISIGLISVRNSNDSNPAARPKGSAVVVRSDGVAVTNYHVINNPRTSRPYDEIYLNLTGDGDSPSPAARYRIKPVLINKEYDLALMRVDSDFAGKPLSKSFTFPSIEIGDSRNIKVLEDLFIIGFPEKGGSTITVNRGVVEGKDILANWIKTDARVIHGNSGGAAVNSEGRLVGIPTKVVADDQPVDRDGDGFPDDSRRYGAVGFLRPAYLVSDMIAQLKDANDGEAPVPTEPKMIETGTFVVVRGMVKSAASGKPIAGALVGLLPVGEASITERTLLTWGSTNSEGGFKLNKPVPPGRYTVKAKAFANQAYSRDVEIGPGASVLVIEMTASSDR